MDRPRMRYWLGTITRQLGILLATTVIGGLLTAALVRHSPGFDADERALDQRLGAESREAIRAEHAANHDVLRFYAKQIGATLRGDFGVSRSLNRPIGELIRVRLPVTLGLMAVGVAGGWTLAFGLALAAVLWRRRAISFMADGARTCALCLPSAVIAAVVFGAGGPVRAILALVLFPRLFDTLRNLLEDAYSRPHILTARSKGMGPVRILAQHVMPACAPAMRSEERRVGKECR